MGPKPLTTEQFIKKAKQAHKNRFIYTDTVYINRRTSIEVRCRIHGKFTTTPDNHIHGNGGCLACSKISGIRKRNHVNTNGVLRTKKPIPFKAFIKKYAKYDNTYIDKANKIHNKKYTYKTTTPIINIETHKFTITCKLHGEFVQTIKNHLNGQECPKCGRAKANASNTTPFSKAVSNANEIHSNNYLYNEASYSNIRAKTEMQCVKCNKTFKMSFDSHINQKQGCPYCKGLYKTLHDVNKALHAIDSNYVLITDSQLCDPTTVASVVSFNCTIHGEVKRKVRDIYRGLGCRQCRTNGFSILKPGILYYLSINNGAAYKIGITNHSVDKRFTKEELESITVLKEWHFEDGYECYKQEQYIKKMYKDYKYKGHNLLTSGNTELFNKDVLNLGNTDTKSLIY